MHNQHCTGQIAGQDCAQMNLEARSWCDSCRGVYVLNKPDLSALKAQIDALTDEQRLELFRHYELSDLAHKPYLLPLAHTSNQ